MDDSHTGTIPSSLECSRHRPLPNDGGATAARPRPLVNHAIRTAIYAGLMRWYFPGSGKAKTKIHVMLKVAAFLMFAGGLGVMAFTPYFPGHFVLTFFLAFLLILFSGVVSVCSELPYRSITTRRNMVKALVFSYIPGLFWGRPRTLFWVLALLSLLMYIRMLGYQDRLLPAGLAFLALLWITWSSRNRLRSVLYSVVPVVYTLGILGFHAVIRAFSWEAMIMVGHSMEPTHYAGALVPSVRLYGEIRADRIYTFAGADADSRSPFSKAWAKRVVAVGPARVEVTETEVHVEGQFIRTGAFVVPHVRGRGIGEWDVPEGFVFVLGDNEKESDDSRAFGPVPKGLITGEIRGRPFYNPDQAEGFLRRAERREERYW